MCKTLRRAGRANGCASRRRRCAGRTNGRTDIRMSEWMDKRASEPTAHDLFIFKCVLFTIARTKARTRLRISVWSLQRGVKARRASPLICSLCRICPIVPFAYTPFSRFHTARSLTFVGVSINERHDSNVSERVGSTCISGTCEVTRFYTLVARAHCFSI